MLAADISPVRKTVNPTNEPYLIHPSPTYKAETHPSYTKILPCRFYATDVPLRIQTRF